MYSNKAVSIVLVALAGSTAASLSSSQYDNDLVARAPELLLDGSHSLTHSLRSEELVTRSPMDSDRIKTIMDKKGRDHAAQLTGGRRPRKRSPMDSDRIKTIMDKKGRDQAGQLTRGRRPRKRSPMDSDRVNSAMGKKGRDHAAGLTGGRRPRSE
jgi:hypothetical protein